MPEDSSKVKIFVGYYKPNKIFKTDVYQPILTAPVEDWYCNDLIKDNTGDNIAYKNKYYAELSGQYWVWKNYLPTAKEKYIGFCHYRRFLDFSGFEMPPVPFKPISEPKFSILFNHYTEENILKTLEDCDIILPTKMFFKSILYAQYLRWHPQKDMDIALNVIRDNYPEYVETAQNTMASTELVTCMHFIMKKELLEDYFKWIFGILFEVEKRSDWSEYEDYLMVRTPAYIAERFFNIWLYYQINVNKIKVKTTGSFLLTGKDYGNDTMDGMVIDKYEAYAQLTRIKEELDEQNKKMG